MEYGPMFLTPVLQERIWGGTALRRFGYVLTSERIGECWGISAHPHGPSRIRNGPLAGQTLDQVWRRHPELFGCWESAGGGSGEEAIAGNAAEGGVCGEASVSFPLLVKILDCNADLSVQVHPDDAYATAHENGEQGKTECWYVLDCTPGAQVVLGHRATTRAELAERMRRGEWESLLLRRPIRPGDFFYVQSGTVHALCQGTLVLEIQQSSDTTYRVYDYDRLDDAGHKRALHVQKALDVIQVPHVELPQQRQVLVANAAARLERLVDGPYFAVYHLRVEEQYRGVQDGSYWLASVIQGGGLLETPQGEWELTCGDHLILPATVETYAVRGQVEIVLARPR